MRTEKKLISFIVPNRTPSKCLQNLLSSMESQVSQIPFELIAVSNPKPASLKVSAISKLDIKWIHSPASGANVSRNLGLKYAKGDWIYFMDDDCRLPRPDFIQSIGDFLAEAKSTEIYGGGYALPTGFSSKHSNWSMAYHCIQMKWILEGRSERYSWQNFVGGNLLVHRDTFQKFHFNEAIKFGATEIEFTNRLLRNGYTGRYLPLMEIEHIHNISKFDLITKGVMQGIGRSLLLRDGLFLENETISKTLAGDFEKYRDEIAVYLKAFELGKEFHQMEIQNPTSMQINLYYLKKTLAEWFTEQSTSQLRLQKIIERI